MDRPFRNHDSAAWGDPVEVWKQNVRAHLEPYKHAGCQPVLHQPVFRLVILVVHACIGSIRRVRETVREMLDAQTDLDALVQDAGAALANGRPDRARELSERGLSRCFSERNREALYRMLAWSGIGLSDPFLAHAALLRLPPASVDVYLLASYLGCCNRVDEAVEILNDARRADHGGPECTRLLADLLFRRGDREAALALARDEGPTLSAEDRNAIEVAVASLQSA